MAAIPEWHGGVQQAQPEQMVRNVVLPLEGSACSRAAVPVARELARLFGATLHVLHAAEKELTLKDVVLRLGLSADELHGAVLDSHGGDPAEAIMRAAQQLPQSLVVMATHSGRHRQDQFGSVTEAVLAANPERLVLVAPQAGAKPFNVKRILLAHDGSPTSDQATAPAAEVARLANAEVLVVHVAARQSEGPEEPGSHPAPRYIDQPQHEWPHWAHEFTGRMLALGAPPSHVHFKLAVTGGQPGSEIAQMARERDTDLVIMSPCHDSQKLRAVVCSSGCPVLLVCSRAS